MANLLVLEVDEAKLELARLELLIRSLQDLGETLMRARRAEPLMDVFVKRYFFHSFIVDGVPEGCRRRHG